MNKIFFSLIVNKIFIATLYDYWLKWKSDQIIARISDILRNDGDIIWNTTLVSTNVCSRDKVYPILRDFLRFTFQMLDIIVHTFFILFYFLFFFIFKRAERDKEL